jgi:hypothetical protein
MISRIGGGVIVALLGMVFWLILLIWPITIAFGILHTYFPAIRAFGWQSCFMIALAIRIIWASGTATSSSS